MQTFVVVTTSVVGLDYCFRKTLASLNGLFGICKQISQLAPFAHNQPLGLILTELNLDFKFKFLHQLLLDFQKATFLFDRTEQQSANEVHGPAYLIKHSPHLVLNATDAKDAEDATSAKNAKDAKDTVTSGMRIISNVSPSSSSFLSLLPHAPNGPSTAQAAATDHNHNHHNHRNHHHSLYCGAGTTTPDKTMRFVLSTAQSKLEEMHVELERLKKMHTNESWIGKQLWPVNWIEESMLLRAYANQLNELIQILLRLGAMRIFPL